MPDSLREQIETAADASGLDLRDLTVLAPQNDPYRWDTPAGHRLAAWFAEQIGKHVRPYVDIHLRGLHYRLIAGTTKPDGKPYINDEPHWIWLGKAAQAAIWLGYVPFERIRDQRNDPPAIYIVNDPASPGHGSLYTGTCIEVPPVESMRPMVWASSPKTRQPYRIVLFGEKSSLASALMPVAAKVQGELILPTGEASDTLIAAMANRAAGDDRPTVVLYFSDFDPSGWQMPISISRKLQGLRHLLHPELQIEVHRVALTREQCITFDLPSTPLKETERRADRWTAIMQREQTELDAMMALRPGALRRIAEDAVAPFFDPTLDHRADALAEAWRAEAEQRLLSSDRYLPACAVIETARFGVITAVESLRQAAAEAERMLPIFGFHEIPVPEPDLEASAPEPLFNTDDDFATASLKLIAAKRLENGEP